MTKPVRRTVRYTTLAEFLADAERAVASSSATTGSWTLAQILEHLARGLEGAVDGFPFRSPWIVRVVARYVFLPRFLKHGMPSGFRLKGAPAEAMVPDSATDLSGALEHLRRAVERMKQASTRQPHPIFGEITAEQSMQLQLRHAELHMSFVSA